MSVRIIPTKRLTYEEVERHASAKDLFVIVHDRVYDITDFLEEHPGGTDVLLELGGLDATKAFEEVDHSADARELLKSLQVGVLHTYVRC
ncbi:cytochrome b5-like heme/steroid binding domain-containing protein [Aspergillus pseudoustus]|uniref:Cytochrome b5-like heme/steroid binding domain-containing protein n=1 Tax=Aspergillus pseudoustus TaxID=1810923 RepID=A0ABR4JRP7_9EURO